VLIEALRIPCSEVMEFGESKLGQHGSLWCILNN